MRRVVDLLLILLFCGLVHAQDTSLEVVIPSQVESPQSLCGPAQPGGYFPVEDLSSPQLKAYAALALFPYINNQPSNLCYPIDMRAAKDSIKIDSACYQVVAGQNYNITFSVAFPCPATPPPIQQELQATIFVPLPYTNAPPEATSVQVISSSSTGPPTPENTQTSG